MPSHRMLSCTLSLSLMNGSLVHFDRHNLHTSGHCYCLDLSLCYNMLDKSRGSKERAGPRQERKTATSPSLSLLSSLIISKSVCTYTILPRCNFLKLHGVKFHVNIVPVHPSTTITSYFPVLFLWCKNQCKYNIVPVHQ